MTAARESLYGPAQLETKPQLPRTPLKLQPQTSGAMDSVWPRPFQALDSSAFVALSANRLRNKTAHYVVNNVNKFIGGRNALQAVVLVYTASGCVRQVAIDFFFWFFLHTTGYDILTREHSTCVDCIKTNAGFICAIEICQMRYRGKLYDTFRNNPGCFPSTVVLFWEVVWFFYWIFYIGTFFFLHWNYFKSYIGETL